MDYRREFLRRYADESNEVAFMKEVLTPIFESLGFQRVKFNHGPGELGKDFILSKANEFGRTEYTAVVVKNGDIQNTSGKDKNNLSEVERQVGQAFTNPIQLTGRPEGLPARVIIVCSGRISATAQAQILKVVPSTYNNVHVDFLSSEELISLIEKHIPNLFDFNVPVLGRYLENLAEKLREECCSDSQLSKITGKIDLQCIKAEYDFKSEQGRKAPTEVRVSSILELHKTIWLQGGNGSGKTYSAYQFIKREIERQKKKRPNSELEKDLVFFSVSATKLRDDLNSTSFIHFLTECAQSIFPSVNADVVKEWVEKFEFVFIIDKFEKNPNTKLVDKLIKDCEKIKIQPTVLILSRVMGDIQFTFQRRPAIYYIKDLNMSDAVSLIKSTLRADQEEAKAAFADLVKNGVLERIPRTPLAINVLSHVFSDEMENTPNNMHEFFDMFFELVLGRWRKGRSLNKTYDYTQVRAFLEAAAYKIVESKDTSIEVNKLTEIAEKILSGISDEETNPETFIREICNNSEIVKLDDNRFEFHHRTYLEFLSGCFYMKHKWADESYIKHIVDPDWEYTMIFAAGGKKECDSVLEKMGEVNEQNLEDKFFKLKNISLTLQALYQSTEKAKTKALEASLDTACSIRDDSTFTAMVKKKFPEAHDHLASLASLNMFATFYSRSSLELVMRKHLLKLKKGRGRAYLISALSMIGSTVKIKYLTDYLATFSVEDNEPECLALSSYISIMGKQIGEKVESLKVVLNLKKVKQLNKRVKEIAAPKKWYKKFEKKPKKQK